MTMTVRGQTTWVAWHLHLCALGAPATDQLLRGAVGPAVDWCRRQQPQASWFFVRYWQYGPHVRLRFRGLDHDGEQHLEQLLSAGVAEVAATVPAPLSAGEYRRHATFLAAAGEGGGPLDLGELWPPGAYRRPYRPEVDRYGGRGLLAESESLFEEASELALAFIRRNPPEAARAGLGLRATWAALDAVAEDRRQRFCRQAAVNWQAWAAPGELGKGPAVPPPARPEGHLPAPLRKWSDRLEPAMAVWRAMLTEAAAERILQAHIHMLHNRLGLTIGQECDHYAALSLAIAEAGVAVGS
jgi:hypothetical protein